MKPKNKKLVYGVGINDADYAVQKYETIEANGARKQKIIFRCPYYRVWNSMLGRCYSSKYQEKQPTYKGCTVSDEWLTFSNFKSWMEKQQWEGRHLDKDLLFEGNKVYSAETCVFVSRGVNNFIKDHVAAPACLLVGVSWHKGTGKFRSDCRNPATGKSEYLGLFTCEKKAHKAWLKRKLEFAHQLAENQTDPRVAKALIERYSKPQIIGE